MAYSVADALARRFEEDEQVLWYDVEYEEDDPSSCEMLSQLVFDEVNRIEEKQPHVLTNYKQFFKKYAGYEPVGLTWGEGNTLQRPMYRETRGLIRMACDTGTALISQHMPKATISTEGADFKMQQLATDLDLFLIGAYYAAGIYTVAPRTFHDSTVCGTGTWTYVPKGTGANYRVEIERVFPAEVVVPEDQCESGITGYTERYRVTRWTKARLRKEYPSRAKFISGDSWSLRQRTSAGPNKVWVIDAYHICGDKRIRTRVAPGVVLEHEEWPFDFFPFDDLHWTLPPSGFYGDGIAYRQYAKQERLDFLHQMIHKGQNLAITPRIFNMPGAPPSTSNIADIGTVVSGRSDPKFLTQQAFGPEIYNWVETIIRAGLEDEGISMATAANVLPAGLESAPAQQEYSFKEAQRFAPVSQRYEHTLAVKVAEKLIAFYAHAAQSGAAPQTKIYNNDFVSVVDWPSVDLERDVFRIQVGASSIETLSPAGKIQAAMNLVSLKLVNPTDARILIRHPDLKHIDDLATSSRRYADAFAGECLRGRQPPIDDLTDLVGLREVLTANYNRVAAIALTNPTRDVKVAAKTLRDAITKLELKEQEQLAQTQALSVPQNVADPGQPPNPDSQLILPPGPTNVPPGAVGPAIDPGSLAAALGPGGADGSGGIEGPPPF